MTHLTINITADNDYEAIGMVVSMVRCMADDDPTKASQEYTVGKLAGNGTCKVERKEGGHEL